MASHRKRARAVWLAASCITFCIASAARAAGADPPATTFASPVAATPAPVPSRSAPPTPTPIATSGATAGPSPTPAGPLYVRGQALTIGSGFFFFTNGSAVRLGSGLTIPPGVKTGSYVRLTLGPDHAVRAIDLEPHTTLAGEIDAADLPRDYLVASPLSIPSPAATTAGSASGATLVTVTIVVHVPDNTPTSDDVYLATNRSSFSPAEIRMDRVDGTTWSTTVSLPSGSVLKYDFTRGTYTTVERDRTGGIEPAHQIVGAPGAKSSDTVLRWADIS